MKPYRNFGLIASILFTLSLMFPGEPSAADIDAKLPDKNNTSSFQVKDSDGKVLMKVRSGGDVGIGTKNPGTRLEIFDSLPSLRLNGHPTSSPWQILVNSFGLTCYREDGGGHDFRIDNSGNIEMPNGRVGIGTVNPGARLEVYDSSLPSLRLNGHPSSSPWQILVNSFGLTFYREDGGGHDFRVDNSGNIEMPNGKVGIGLTSPQESLHTAGKIRTDGIAGIPGGLDVRVFQNTLYYQISSASYKKNIRDLKDEFNKILQANPKSFVDKKFGLNEIGYIAEDLDRQGLNNLVIYDNEKPVAIKYDLVSLYILEVVKIQDETIKKQEKEIREQRKNNRVLEERLAKLEKLVVGSQLNY